MNDTQPRPSHRMQAIGGRLVLAALHSPLRFLLQPGIAELTYTGPRTGRVIQLPVMYSRAGDQVAVLAGGGHEKTWWRNFRRPNRMHIDVGGQLWHGTAVVTCPGTAEFHAALDLYHKRFPTVRYRPGDQLIAITLDTREAVPSAATSRHGRWARWMYHGGRPNRMAAAMNRFWQAAASAGIWPSRLATLEVRGRRSGRPVRLPVVIADYGGQRYLVAMLGDSTSWAANVRATNGNALLHHGDYEAVHLEEVEVTRRAPVLRRYLQVAPGARPLIPVSPQADLREFDAVASRYPVFRIAPAVQAKAARPIAP